MWNTNYRKQHNSTKTIALIEIVLLCYKYNLSSPYYFQIPVEYFIVFYHTRGDYISISIHGVFLALAIILFNLQCYSVATT